LGVQALYPAFMENASSATKYRIAAAILALAIIIAAIFLFARKGGEGGAIVATSTASTTALELPTPENPVIQGDGYTISLENGPDITAPNYKVPIAFSADIPGDVRKKLNEEMATLVSRISKDKYDLRSWIDLGTLHKMGGDYKTAEKFWVYVSKLAPTNTIAFENLGDLYQNFLKDYPKAEASWLAAIKIAPQDTNTYHSLFDLYNDLEKKPAAAEAILKKGLAANPKAIDLYIVLARFYKTAGRTADAEAQFRLAIQAAQAEGQTVIADQIKAEAGL